MNNGNGNPTQLTKEGFEKLKLELQELKDVKRPLAVEALQKARAMGDLSENSAYHAAKEEQALVEGRISELEYILKSALVVTNNVDKSTVSLGSTILVDLNGSQSTFQIVGEFEADPGKNKLSVTSPLGKGFLGKHVNETVEIEIPAGKSTYKILRIS